MNANIEKMRELAEEDLSNLSKITTIEELGDYMNSLTDDFMLVMNEITNGGKISIRIIGMISDIMIQYKFFFEAYSENKSVIEMVSVIMANRRKFLEDVFKVMEEDANGV